MRFSPLLTHNYSPAARSRCEHCSVDEHRWGEPEYEHIDDQLALCRWYCTCPQCPLCPGLSVAVSTFERWHGQHRLI